MKGHGILEILCLIALGMFIGYFIFEVTEMKKEIKEHERYEEALG